MNDDHATNNTVCAIVVSCNPDRAVFAELLTAVRAQVDEVVIVDNASDDEFRDWLRTQPADRLRLLELPENVGVGTAHNIGIGAARRLGHSYVLLLDHDSVPAVGMIGALLTGLQSLSQYCRVAAVGPSYRDPRTNTAGRLIRSRGASREIPPYNAAVPVDFLITSGTLISLATLDDVGRFDDGLFVDYVDTDWCLRAAARGYRLFAIRTAGMRHTIGDDVSRVCGMRIADYSPQRLYYHARNQILLTKRHRARGASTIRTLLRTLRLGLYYGLLRGPRWRNLAAICRGLLDGMRNRSGRRDLVMRPDAWRDLLERARRAAEIVERSTPDAAA